MAGLREDIVSSPEHVLALLDEGEGNRHIGSTKMNERSSRSHTLFRMVRLGCAARWWAAALRWQAVSQVQ